MKIEKINDNQIRCTLTREDLADRQIKLSEIAYGSEKARSLFREMIQQANYEFGFDASDIPLMVEAIPASMDTIVLVISKVEYPEELDTRFSKFSEPDEDLLDEEQSDVLPMPEAKGADDILGLFRKMKEASKNAGEQEDKTESFAETLANTILENKKKAEEPKETIAIPVDLTKMFVFRSMERVETFAHVLNGFYQGSNDLYRNEKKGVYVLFLHKGDHTPEEFNKVCNIASEYSLQQTYTNATYSFYQEHCRLVLAQRALQVLQEI